METGQAWSCKYLSTVGTGFLEKEGKQKEISGFPREETPVCLHEVSPCPATPSRSSLPPWYPESHTGSLPSWVLELSASCSPTAVLPSTDDVVRSLSPTCDCECCRQAGVVLYAFCLFSVIPACQHCIPSAEETVRQSLRGY